MVPWCSGYRYCTTSFNKAWTQVLCRFKSCSQRVRHLHYSNIIPLFYVDSETVKKTAAILEPWLAKAEHIKDTRNHHQFVPEGSSMRMIRISGSTTNVDNHIVNNNRMDLNDITHGPYYACKYDDLYFYIVNYISMEHGGVNVKFMHPKAPARRSFWPNREDVCWIPLNHMICRVEPPSTSSTARYYSFDEADINQVLGYL